MKIDYELTEKDYNSIAEIIIEKSSEKAYMETLIETQRKVVENKYWWVFDKMTHDSTIIDLVKKEAGKIIVDTIKAEKLLEIEVRKAINIDELKKLGAKRLREIASELEKEAEYLCQ